MTNQIYNTNRYIKESYFETLFGMPVSWAKWVWAAAQILTGVISVVLFFKFIF